MMEGCRDMGDHEDSERATDHGVSQKKLLRRLPVLRSDRRQIK
jgi:hypothetical protein